VSKSDTVTAQAQQETVKEAALKEVESSDDCRT